MPPKDLDKLTRIRTYEGEDVVVLRPGIAITMYSQAEVGEVMIAAADVLEAYLDFVPPGAIAALYEPPSDEYSPGEYVQFNSSTRRDLLDDLRAGPPSLDVGGDGFELTATSNGHAGDYGAMLGAINFTDADVANKVTSLLRLELPWNLLDTIEVDEPVDFFERVTKLFPFCSGNAGLSFIYTISYTTPAKEELQKLMPRFHGFDCDYNTAQLRMRGKSPPAHWLNFLDADLVAALGGEEALRSKLSECEVRSVSGGVLIRAAKFPPVVDVNRQGTDIGCLPSVARVLRPVRFDKATFVGLPDAQSGQAWLDRFDDLASGDWDNS
jgi:hypothetical protein